MGSKTDNGKDSAFQAQQSSSGSTLSGGHNYNECQDGKRGGYKRDGRRGNHSYRGGNKQNRDGHHRQDGQQQRHCTYCDLTNHTVDFCNTKRRHEKTDRERAELAKKRKIDEGNVAVDL